MFKHNKDISILLIWLMMALLAGCNEKESTNETKAVPKKSHPVSMSASIEDYSAMDQDERKESCENNYIEISGVVYRDGNSFKIVNENRDGIVISCAFDNYTDEMTEISNGDYVTISGLCSSSFEDSMFLYECQLASVIKAMESEELEVIAEDIDYLADIDVYSENVVTNYETNNADMEENIINYSDASTDNSSYNSEFSTDNYINNEVYTEVNKESESEENNNQQNNPNIDYSQGRYAVNDKNGKIHAVGECIATTGSGNQLMVQPVFFDTLEEAEDYSKQYHPQQEKRRCGNCWKDWY